MEQKAADETGTTIRHAATDVARSTPAVMPENHPRSAAPLCPPPASAMTSMAFAMLARPTPSSSIRVGSKRARSPSKVTTNRAAMAPVRGDRQFRSNPSVGRMTKAMARARPAPWLTPRRSGLASGLRSKRCKMKAGNSEAETGAACCEERRETPAPTRARSSGPASDHPSGPRPRLPRLQMQPIEAGSRSSTACRPPRPAPQRDEHERPWRVDRRPSRENDQQRSCQQACSRTDRQIAGARLKAHA